MNIDPVQTRLLVGLLCLLLASVACGRPAALESTPGFVASGTPRVASQPTRAPAATAARATAPASPLPARSAHLFELVNDVFARAGEAVDWAAARDGQVIQAGGGVQTWIDSSAALQLSEGTLIRLGAETTFTLTEFETGSQDPFTRLHLFAGRLWVVLARGVLEVESPSGVASVRGSLLGVAYDPDSGRYTVTCLEGHCSLSNGGQQVELEAGQAAEVSGADAPPSAARPLTAEEVNDWLANSPEATLVPLPTVASPTDAPTATAPPTATTAPPTTPAPTATPAPTVPPPITVPAPPSGGGPICFYEDTGEQVDCASIGVGG